MDNTNSNTFENLEPLLKNTYSDGNKKFEKIKKLVKKCKCKKEKCECTK